MARNVQQENIYERKTKVIKKEGRWERYYISLSLVIFHNHCCGKAGVFLISMKKALDGTLIINSHVYTSIILNVTVFDWSLPYNF